MKQSCRLRPGANTAAASCFCTEGGGWEGGASQLSQIVQMKSLINCPTCSQGSLPLFDLFSPSTVVLRASSGNAKTMQSLPSPATAFTLQLSFLMSPARSSYLLFTIKKIPQNCWSVSSSFLLRVYNGFIIYYNRQIIISMYFYVFQQNSCNSKRHRRGARARFILFMNILIVHQSNCSLFT